MSNNGVELTSDQYKDLKRGKFKELDKEDIEYFREIFQNSNQLLQSSQELDERNVDVYRLVKGQSKIILRPSTPEELSSILKYCNEKNLAVTPQGGNTGLVFGGVPVFDEIIISMDLMDKIISFNELTGVLQAQAGSTLFSLRTHVESLGFIFPLDLAPEKKCQIGGNISTNAGGLKLFRYGSLHANVLGLEAVLANGEIMDLMSIYKKDNTGYDLKQLLIGSEGTLGIITKVVIQCPPKPKTVGCLLFGVKSYEVVKEIYKKSRNYFNEMLTCCEIMDSESMSCVTQNNNLELPFQSNLYYLVFELSSCSAESNELEQNAQNFIKLLTTHLEFDYIFSMDSKEIMKIWELRKGIGMALTLDGYAFKYDFSIPLEDFHEFLMTVRNRLKGSKFKRCIGFGHLGDSNLHLVITSESYSPELKNRLEPFLYEWVKGVKGSISAEHGLGLKEKKYISYSKGQVAIQMMKRIKGVFDPRGILNPYKLFPDT